MKLLKELCEAPGISGREQAIIEIMSRELRKTTDNVEVDGLGNVIARREGAGKAPVIMLAAHMDEIGFIVSHIDNNGFLRFSPRGGHIPRVLISQRVKIYGRKVITGVVEGNPPFLASPENQKKIPELRELFIDTGYKRKELDKIISIGDQIVLDRGFIEQGNVYLSKAFDNRVACYIICEVMRLLPQVASRVYAVGTAQEEVGLRGAWNAARKISPDFGIAVDITGAYDIPGVAEHEQVTRLGEGAAIKINDSNSISNHGLVEFLKHLAEENKIKYQMEILPFGGTDAAAMQRYGAGPVCTISIPTRYAHSPNEMIHKTDLKSAIKLLLKFIERSRDCQISF